MSGCSIPTLIDRTDDFSGSPLVRFTNLTASRVDLSDGLRGGAAHHRLRGRQGPRRDRLADPGPASRNARSASWASARGGGSPSIPRHSIPGHRSRLDRRGLRASRGNLGRADRPQRLGTPPRIRRRRGGAADLFGGRALLVEACPGPIVTGPNPPRAGRSDAASGRLDGPNADDGARRIEADSPPPPGLATVDQFRPRAPKPIPPGRARHGFRSGPPVSGVLPGSTLLARRRPIRLL